MAFFKLIRRKCPQHEKLCEELTKNKTTEEQVLVDTDFSEAVIFKLKYLGCTKIENNLNENVRSKAVENIFKSAKERKTKDFPTVTVKISSHGITVTNSQGHDMLKVSIYRISNCSNTDAQRQVFSFISSDLNNILTCHAFLCPKRKIARNVTLAVGNAFNTAYQTWSEFSTSKEDTKNETTQYQPEEFTKNPNHDNYPLESVDRLIDFDGDVFNDTILVNTNSINIKNNWVLFEEVASYSNFCNDKFQ